MKCPKCGAEARDVARFCQRCHATLRYQCPSCKHEQRQGGKCEKCGVDFLKYVTAVVAAKQAEADVVHDRIDQRSALLRNLLTMPFNLGIPLIRSLFVSSRKSRS
ncbi:MAG: zinc-ribbon domain-containing protein [Acidobacteriia bacterium]|nr:zinc-ribbon domain-containing protein [Terriglobia bacterium]